MGVKRKASFWYLGSAGPSSPFGCPSCWKLSKVSSITAYNPTCVMYCIGSLYMSGYSIVSLQWSPVVSLAAPPITFATSAAQCRFWPHVGCCVLLRGGSFWSLGPVWLLCSEGSFRLCPSAWNDLPSELRSLLMAHPSKFYICLKFFF